MADYLIHYNEYVSRLTPRWRGQTPIKPRQRPVRGLSASPSAVIWPGW